MLEKTMKQLLSKKIKGWLESIDDDDIVKAINKDLIITGGCFPSMILNETPKDFDCYFRTKETVLLIANYYARKWNEGHENLVFVLDGSGENKDIVKFYGNDKLDELSVVLKNCAPERVKMLCVGTYTAGDPDAVGSKDELGAIEEIDETKADEVIEKEERKFYPVFISTNAITLSNGIQIVVRFYGEPDEIHETYDFEHTKAYYDHGNNDLVIPKKVYECVINKTLIYTGSKYPVCSLFRLRKFISRGWSINAGQILKMCMQVSELDLMDIDVLEDQLIGVDSLYFMSLIDQFRKKKANDDTFVLSSNYLISIIDKIF